MRAPPAAIDALTTSSVLAAALRALQLEIGGPLTFPPDSIILHLSNGWYTADTIVLPNDLAAEDAPHTPMPGHARVDANRVKRMYTYSFLTRIATVQRAIRQARSSADTATAKITEVLGAQSSNEALHRSVLVARTRM